MLTLTSHKPPKIHYPDSDGMPIADNSLQFEWIVTVQGNLDLIFRDDPNVLVAGDHLIYPVDGDIATRFAPDVYVVFGRPKGHRGSYVLCEEEGVFPQVIFEVWSACNRQQEMEKKRRNYERYGAEEYYILYPDFPEHAEGWRREDGRLVVIPELNGFVSPRLRIKFELIRGKLTLYRPDGSRFLTYVEQGVLANEEHKRAEAEHRLALAESQRAEAETQRAEAEHRRAETERLKAEKLAARFRELGVDPDSDR